MNRWERIEHISDDVTSTRIVIPANVAAPTCDFCGGEIRDASMAMIIWNDHAADDKPFDGFHLAHKIECDPGRRAGDDYRSSIELSSAIQEPRAVLAFAIRAIDITEKYAPLSPELRRNIFTTLGTVIALGIASLELDHTETAEWPEIFANFIEDRL